MSKTKCPASGTVVRFSREWSDENAANVPSDPKTQGSPAEWCVLCQQWIRVTDGGIFYAHAGFKSVSLW